MPKLTQQAEACSVALALQLIGDRWTLLIVRDAMYGVRRFQDFQASIGLAKNVLADRLGKLVGGGVMEPVPLGAGHWHEYRLTAMGRDLFTAVVALMQWGDRWINPPRHVAVRLADRQTGEPVAPVEVRSRSGRPLALADVAVRAGPGAARPEAQRQLAAYTRAFGRTGATASSR